MALVYCSNKSGGINLKIPHDPSAVLDYSFIYKPALYKTNFQYSRGDLIIPPIFSGYYFECRDSGISSALGPVWPTDLGESVDDNTVNWIAREYNFYLGIGEGLQTDGLGGYLSTWVATNGVTIGNAIANDRSTKVWVQAVPAGVTKFSLTNRFETTYGRIDERTLNVKVLDR